MHIENWDDHGLPRFSPIDKKLLGYFFEYGNNACYHCSAGMERSPAMIATKMFYQQLSTQSKKEGLTDTALCTQLMANLETIKKVKPAAGEPKQILAIPGLAEDAYISVKDLEAKVTDDSKKEVKETKEEKEEKKESAQTSTTSNLATNPNTLAGCSYQQAQNEKSEKEEVDNQRQQKTDETDEIKPLLPKQQSKCCTIL